MLVLKRRSGEDLVLETQQGDRIVIRYIESGRLGISAPMTVKVHRAELYETITGNQPPAEANTGGNDIESPVKLVAR